MYETQQKQTHKDKEQAGSCQCRECSGWYKQVTDGNHIYPSEHFAIY